MRHAAYDLLVVGAGPAGLATAIEGQRRGLRVIVIDRGTGRTLELNLGADGKNIDATHKTGVSTIAATLVQSGSTGK